MIKIYLYFHFSLLAWTSDITARAHFYFTEHEPDGLVRTPEGNIVIESKRKERGNVTAIEAEEILGKGARYDPIANVTIGFPDFVEEAKKNVPKNKITLIKASVLGEILVRFWEGKLDQKDVISILKSTTYIRSLYKKGNRQTQMILVFLTFYI